MHADTEARVEQLQHAVEALYTHGSSEADTFLSSMEVDHAFAAAVLQHPSLSAAVKTVALRRLSLPTSTCLEPLLRQLCSPDQPPHLVSLCALRLLQNDSKPASEVLASSDPFTLAAVAREALVYVDEGCRPLAPVVLERLLSNPQGMALVAVEEWIEAFGVELEAETLYAVGFALLNLFDRADQTHVLYALAALLRAMLLHDIDDPLCQNTLHLIGYLSDHIGTTVAVETVARLATALAFAMLPCIHAQHQLLHFLVQLTGSSDETATALCLDFWLDFEDVSHELDASFRLQLYTALLPALLHHLDNEQLQEAVEDQLEYIWGWMPQGYTEALLQHKNLHVCCTLLRIAAPTIYRSPALQQHLNIVWDRVTSDPSAEAFRLFAAASTHVSASRRTAALSVGLPLVAHHQQAGAAVRALLDDTPTADVYRLMAVTRHPWTQGVEDVLVALCRRGDTVADLTAPWVDLLQPRPADALKALAVIAREGPSLEGELQWSQLVMKAQGVVESEALCELIEGVCRSRHRTTYAEAFCRGMCQWLVGQAEQLELSVCVDALYVMNQSMKGDHALEGFEYLVQQQQCWNTLGSSLLAFASSIIHTDWLNHRRCALLFPLLFAALESTLPSSSLVSCFLTITGLLQHHAHLVTAPTADRLAAAFSRGVLHFPPALLSQAGRPLALLLQLYPGLLPLPSDARVLGERLRQQGLLQRHLRSPDAFSPA